ncbi:MAG: ABC transporter substrate-binding protein [Clostridiales bacterium]|nr:ABC transporter substrate-binding protein [Clostridiales bacterium]
MKPDFSYYSCFKRILCLLLCFFLLAGCSDFTGEEEAEDDNTARLAILDKETEAGERENIISMTMRSPKTLNPLLNEDVTVDKVLKLIYEPLFNISEEQSVIPNLAASYSISDDGLVMRVTLKDGLKWQNGEDITAEDAAYSLDTIRAASDEAIYKYVLTNISDYYMEDGLTLVIVYDEVYSAGVYNLCFPVIPKYYYGDDTLPTVGSGPYSIESYDTRQYNLTAADGVNGTPSIEGVKVLISPDYDTDYNAFNQGITDVLDTSSAGWYSYFADKECTKAIYSTNNFEYLGFNNNLDMFKNQAVKQAVAYCIDREEIISGIYMNNLEDSLTPVNPAAYMSSSESTASYDYNTDEALAVLWNSGLSPYNYSFKILVNEDNPERVETANVIAESLNLIGMNVTADPRPYEEYAALIEADDFEVFLGGTSLRCGFDLRPLLLSSASYSGTNYVNYSDSTMDTLLTAEAEAIGEEAVKEALREVERYISVQLPLIGIGFKTGVVMTSSDIKGMTIPYISNCFVNAARWSIG